MDALNHLPSFYMSANSPYGFFSYCDDIINMKTRNRMYILKGGPGTGKSSLMKKIAVSLAEKGHSIELIYCSSDPSSLDGVIINDLNTIIIDGTAPHVWRTITDNSLFS